MRLRTGVRFAFCFIAAFIASKPLRVASVMLPRMSSAEELLAGVPRWRSQHELTGRVKANSAGDARRNAAVG